MELQPQSASPELCQILFAEATEGIFISDAQGHFREVNPQACELLGYSQAELVHLFWRDLLPKGDSGPSPLDLANRNNGQTVQTQSQLCGKNGHSFTAEVRLRSLADGRRVAFVRNLGEHRPADETRYPYALLADHSRDIILVVSYNDGRIVEANARASEIYGYSRDELLTLSIQDLRTPETRALTAAQMAQAYSQGILFETLHRRKDGSIFPVEVNSTGMILNETSVLISIIRDISERKQAEEILQQREAKYYQLFSEMSTGGALHEIICNDDGTPVDYITLEVNHAYEVFLNIKSENVIGQKASGILPQAELEKWLEIFGSVALTGKSTYYEMYSPSNQKYFEGSAYCPEKGKFAVTFTDITEHKRAEEQLHIALEKYRALFETFPLGISITDERGNLIEVNRESERLLGLDRQDHLRRSYDGPEWRIIRPDGLLMPPDEYASVRALREKRLVENVEMGIVKGNDEITWINVTAAPIPLEGYGVAIAYGDITERKLAEAALRESEERFRLFMDNSPTTAWMQDDQSRYVYLNRTYEKRFGVRLEEWRGKTIFEIWPAEVAAKYRQNDLKVLAAGHLLNFTQQIPNPDGSYSTWWIFKFPFQNEMGQRYMAGVGLDITERQQMEEALHQSEERFAKAFRASPYALIISCLADGRIIEVNDRWQEVLGYSREEAIGQSSLALNIFVNPAERQRAVAQLQKEGSVRDFEMKIRRKTGQIRQVSLSSELIELNNEPCLLTTIRDITEHRQIEETLYLTRFSVERATDAIYWFDEAGRIVDINETACRMLGYSREDLLHLSVDAIDPGYTPDLWQQAWQFVKQHQRAMIETIQRTKAGQFIPVEVVANYIEFGGRVLSCCFVRDITERKAAEEARAKLEEQLRQAQKMESVGRLAGGVAHDFNNLLTVILGYSELMQARLPLNGSVQEQLEQIRQSAKRAEALTRQLLAFSRKQMLIPEVFDLNELVMNLRKMLERLIGEDIALVTVLQPDLWSIKADPGQIEQVIMNLVVNARDAMPTGGRLIIETTNLSPEDYFIQTHAETLNGPGVRLTVTDTGYGMDQATQSHIFEPFFTTKEQGKGTGLGLATVYGIIKQSGGDITVDSQPGQGTTFSLYLPAHATDLTASTAPRPEPLVQTGGETILLVEDELVVRDFVRVALDDYGYTLLEVEHGYQALALAQQEKTIDLLLTDVVMPDINGRELAERIKALHPQIKILFMSGYTDNEFIRRGVQMAEVEFMAKPFSPVALAAKIREILDK